MNIAEFKTELARLIKRGLTAGLSIDDMADELTEASEDLPEQELDYHSDPSRAAQGKQDPSPRP